MEQLQEKINKQLELGNSIEKLAVNYGKDSKDRKTKEYLSTRLKTLQEQWDEFEINDDIIRELCPTPTTHDYFTKEFYQQVEQVYLKLKADIENRLKGIVEIKAAARKSLPDNSKLNQLITSFANTMATLRSILAKVDQPQWDSESANRHLISRIEKFQKLLEEKEVQICSIGGGEKESVVFPQDEYQVLQVQAEQSLMELKMKVEGGGSSRINTDLSVQPSVKLNQISIPKFNGEHAKWNQFYDLFNQLVHQQNISNAIKMFYLKDNISGEAEQLIRNLTVSDANYNAAWSILKEKYDDKRELLNSWFKRIINQKVINTPTSENVKRLHDGVREATLAIDSLNISFQNLWEGIVLYLTANKLDNTSRTLYEQSLTEPQELQSLGSFLKFLQTRYRSLGVHTGEKPKHTPTSMMAAQSQSQHKLECVICQKDHPIYCCEQFQKMSPADRNEAIFKAKLCLNCLKRGHFANKCSSRSCTRCGKKHNTLLHSEYKSNKVSTSSSKSPSNEGKTAPASNISTTLNIRDKNETQTYVVLGTAKIEIKDYDGNWVQCRALIDPGSQVHIATQKLQKKLKLDGHSINSRVAGLGESRIDINNRINVNIRSMNSTFTTTIDALVMKKITTQQPQMGISTENWHIPTNIKLADPNFNAPQNIDILLGAELYGDLILSNQLKLGKQLPTLQESTLGWLVIGAWSKNNIQYNGFCGIGTSELDEQIKQFWNLEEYVPKKRFTPEEITCETLFDATTIRKDGRFVVKLPLKNNPSTLGDSKGIAYNRLMGIERKLKKDKDLQIQYINFMKDYESQGHMEEITEKILESPSYYMPHHCVLKPTSSTTKLRVVFDASAKTSNNIALNEIMLTGPRIQDELFAILLRFRLRKYVFTADIQQMYRQIRIAPEDTNLQLILWRENESLPIKTYRLRTVTYGTKAAPYLATKCLQRLAEDEDGKYPLGTMAMKDFYVDDLITGTDNLNEAVNMQYQVRQLLEAGSFRLRKWCANHPRLLEGIDQSDLELKLDFNSKQEEFTKPLGLIWHPVTDQFQITVTLKEHEVITKRTILSDTAQLFDPLGLVNPVVVTAKIFMQKLWALNMEWDAEVPSDISEKWKEYQNGLTALQNKMIPRYMFTEQHSGRVVLHTFADASEKAYGAAVYLKTINKSGEHLARLLCSRSRVAPSKQTKLPLLELCAAKMAAELSKTVADHLCIPLEDIYYWSDSEIVLSWIRRDAATLVTFVANRVADIQSVSNLRKWRYVPSKENPADLVSRGCTAQQLLKEKIWFDGPDFLRKSQQNWPKQPQEERILKEYERTLKCVLTTTVPELNIIERMNHGNSFRKMQRIIAFIIRGIRKFKLKTQHTSSPHGGTVHPTAEEMDTAMLTIFKIIQQPTYATEIKCINQRQPLPKGSCLTSLAPFVDYHGILRVGGRIQQSALTYDEQHPIVLPKSHFVTRLYVALLHVNNLHAGPQALTAISRQRVWIPQARQLARSVVNCCIRCVKTRPLLGRQIMGQLPYHRVTAARPFINCGVDFCGPVWTHFKIRGKKAQKTYIAVFVCFATKAVHLEVVSDLTTNAFIGSLKRFMARRGASKNIYCDKAKNFVGTHNKFRELQDVIWAETAKELITSHCSERRIQFHFIPPRAPHMGGLWEAAVKSLKNLLCRSVTSTALTYEELCTVTAEIESVLNSRPITPLSSNPNDLNALTPGHFLIGEPTTATVHPHASDTTMSLLSRWQLVSYCKAEFWKRWSTEYLTSLQVRAKWAKDYLNMMNGTMVVIKEDNLPPLQWALGRVIDVITGPDGHARVADVRTSSGTIRRAIHTLAPLPIDITEEHPIEQLGSETEKEQSTMAIENNESKNVHQKSRIEVETPTKRRRPSLGLNTTTAVITLLCILPLIAAAHVTVQQFQHNAGIFYDAKGHVRFTPTHWTIMAYVKLDTYYAMEEEIQTAISIMKDTSSKMSQLGTHTEIIKYFEDQFARAKQYNEVLLYDTESHIRSKRAAINLVGTIFNKLFGILDDEYAQSMRSTIDNVQSNESTLKQLLDNHTSILDATMNVFKRDRLEIINQTLQFKALVDNDIETLNKDWQQEKVERRLGEMSSIANISHCLFK